MIRALRLWLLRWKEEALLCSCGHHQAMADLHAEQHDKASAELRRVRSRLAALTPSRQLLDEALARTRGRA